MKRILFALFSISCLIIAVITLSSSSTGITGVSSTGCTCHTASPSTATVLGITGFPSSYVLGQAYPITVSVTNASKLAGGFDLTVSAGNISGGPAGTIIQPTFKEIGHTTPKAFTSGSCSWTFTWTAPSTGSASITVNYAANAVNLASGSSGDVWNKTSIIVGPPIIPFTATATTSAILCNGGTSTITCSGSYGTMPYEYKLNSGSYQGSNVFTGNAAGVYTVTIRDAAFVTASTVKTITQPSVLTLTPSGTNISCFGGTNGSANVVASGGTSSYTYSWAPSGGNGATASGLSPGTYTCTVSDANSCTKTATVVITQPTQLSGSITASSNVTCNGLSNGVATVTPSGGTPGYTYFWMPSGATTATASGLPSGFNVCTITDNNSCTYTSSIYISQPTALNANISSASNVTCFGLANGSATIAPSGGTLGYTFSWAPTGGNGVTASGLSANSYTCTVTDANLCTKTATINITQPAFVDVSANASSTNLCNGNILTLTGSNSAADPNYTYTWSSGAVNNSPFVATATTTYTVTGSSSLGCTDQGTIAVTVNSNSNLALASPGNATSVAGNVCVSMQQIDGQTEVYTNSSCATLASIFDQSGGNNLGLVNVCVDVLNTVQTYNGEPYASRIYTITPTNQGPGTITLYYTHDDIVKLNNFITSNASPYPILNFPNASPLNGDQITNASITKVSGGPLGIGTGSATPVLLTYNASQQVWIGTLSVSNFSSFYLHPTNFGNAALPVDLVFFEGRNMKNEQQLMWSVNNEKNIAAYTVEHSIDGIQFTEVGKLSALSLKETAVSFSYSFTNTNVAFGHNYYRLGTIGIDGDVSIISQVIDIRRDAPDEQNISIWPNPVQDAIHLDIETKDHSQLIVTVMDVTGKHLSNLSMNCSPGVNRKTIDVSGFTEGVYWLKVVSPNTEVKTIPLTIRR